MLQEQPIEIALPFRGGPPAVRFHERQRFVRSLLASLSVHVLVLLALFFLPGPQVARGRRQPPTLRLEVAVREPTPRPPEEVEPVPEVVPPEVQDEPELVPLPEPRSEPPIEPWRPPPDPELDLPDPFAGLSPESLLPPEALADPPPAVEPEPALPPEPRTEPTGDEGDFEPEVLYDPIPKYPPRAAVFRRHGTVRLRIEVGKAGTVTRIQVVESSGHEDLDRAARDAFERWRFSPWKAGEPEVRAFVKSFTFSLGD